MSITTTENKLPTIQVFRASVGQSGTLNPYFYNVKINTLYENPPSITRDGVGDYTIHLTDGFPQYRTLVNKTHNSTQIGAAMFGANAGFDWLSKSEIRFRIWNDANALTELSSIDTSGFEVEIEVFNNMTVNT